MSGRFDHLHHITIHMPSVHFSDRHARATEIEAWCNQQFGLRDHRGVHGRWFRRGYFDWYFRDAPDAMLFKLTWAGES